MSFANHSLSVVFASPMPTWIGIIALVVAFPGSINACVTLYDRFLANRERRTVALPVELFGRWGLRLFNLTSLALLVAVIVGTWVHPPNLVAPPPPAPSPTASPPSEQLKNELAQVTKERDDLRSQNDALRHKNDGQSQSSSLGYVLDEGDIRKLRDAVANIRGILPDHINLSTADDPGARNVANGLAKGFRLAGVNTDGMRVGTPLNVSERGVSIRVHPGTPPTAALAARDAITRVMKIPPSITPNPKMGEGGFEIFVGTNPNEN